MSWETLEEILTSSIGFVIAMVIMSVIIGVGLYGYWVYVNHQTLENYLWPVAEVVPYKGGYYLGIVNTGNEPIIVEDIYTNNSKVLSVNSKPLSHNQWLFEILSSLPVAVRVCSAIDPRVCTVVPVHGWGYARLFGGVWVTFNGDPYWPGCAWKLIWYGGNGGMIQSSQSLSWFIPTNETIYFHADAVVGYCTGATISGPGSAEPGQSVTFSITCYNICGGSGSGGGSGGGGNNNSTNGPPSNSTNKPPSCSITLVPSYIEESKPGNYTVTVTAELGKGCPTGGTWTWGPYYNYYVVDYFVNGTPITGAWGSVYGENGVSCDVNGVNGNGPSATVVITCS
jgi:hypothetical protein